VVEKIVLSEPKTKTVAGVLKKLNADRSALIVTARPEQNLIKSARNLPSVATTIAEQLNVLDILTYDYLIFTQEALEKAQEVFGE
jgi:large subunit ribosomal protein L4